MSDRDAVPEHVAVFRHLRQVFGDPAVRGRDARRRRGAGAAGGTAPYGAGREPRDIVEVVDDLAASRGWESPLAQADLRASWSEIIGPDNAAHTRPVAIEGGVLTVRCDSNSWATQLRMLRTRVVAGIAEQHAAAGIADVRFIGPDAPSWNHGRRTVPGRGPRDTYG
jgi:predicted nucleic acid-binding Zn ribbon protein